MALQRIPSREAPTASIARLSERPQMALSYVTTVVDRGHGVATSIRCRDPEAVTLGGVLDSMVIAQMTLDLRHGQVRQRDRAMSVPAAQDIDDGGWGGQSTGRG